MENYPFILEATHCSQIVALSDTEIEKVIVSFKQPLEYDSLTPALGKPEGMTTSQLY